MQKTTVSLLFTLASVLATSAVAGPGPVSFTGHSLDTQARLVWEEAPGATYNVYRSLTLRRSATPTDQGVVCNWQNWPGLGGLCTFDDQGLTNGTAYNYWVTSVIASVESSPAGHVTVIPAIPPEPPPRFEVERNRTVAGPTVTIPPEDASYIPFREQWIPEGVAIGGVTLYYDYVGATRSAAPVIQAHIEGPRTSDLGVSAIATTPTSNLLSVSEYRWSPFVLSPKAECQSILFLLNRSTRAVTAEILVNDFLQAPITIGPLTLTAGEHRQVKIESGTPSPEQKTDCYGGSFTLDHDGTRPDDILAYVQGTDSYDLGRQFEKRLVAVGDADEGTVYTSGLLVDADNFTRVTIRNNAPVELEVRSLANLDGDRAETIRPTIYAFWETALDPDVTGYRIYRRPLCAPTCDPWQRLNDAPIDDRLWYADGATLALDQEYEYTIAATNGYFNEGILAEFVIESLPSLFTGEFHRYLPYFAYDAATDTDVRLRNTIDYAIRVQILYRDQGGQLLGTNTVVLPPNRSVLASAKTFLAPLIGATAVGSIEVIYTGADIALVVDARWNGTKDKKLDVASTPAWTGTHPGRVDVPRFYIGHQVGIDSTIYLHNLDDEETVVVPTYSGMNLFLWKPFTCTGDPVVVPPRGSTTVYASLNGKTCMDGSFIGAVRLDSTWTATPTPANAASRIAATLAMTDRGEMSFTPNVTRGVTLYQSLIARGLIDPVNAVGTVTSNPVDVAPPQGSVVYYALDDGQGFPRRIDMIRAGADVRIFY